MLIAFFAVSMFIGMFLSYIWKSTSIVDLVIKITLRCYTIWAVVMFIAAMWQYVDTGKMKLF